MCWEKKMNRIIKILMCAVMMLGLSGCRQLIKPKQETRVPNEHRGTDYKYDFMDYITVVTYGDEGSGFIEVNQKAIDVYDFASEKDYIAVKKDLETFRMGFKQEVNNNGSLRLSKTSGLNNGDIVTLSLDLPKDYVKNSDINTEPYDYVVHDLGTAREIDLFSSDLVTFYATEAGNVCYHVDNVSYLDDELVNNLVYYVKSTGEIKEGVTILDCSVSMNESFLKKNEYYTFDIYMAKHHLKPREKTTERVLSEIIKPISYSSSNQIEIEKALYASLYLAEPQLAKICNLQQSERQASSDPYKVTLVYYTTDEYGTKEFYRRDIELHYVNEQYVVYSLGERNGTYEIFTSEPYDDSSILMNFNLERLTEEEIRQQKEAERAEAEKAKQEELAKQQAEAKQDAEATEGEAKEKTEGESSDAEGETKPETDAEGEKTETQEEQATSENSGNAG